ncbi:80da0c8a-c322-4e4c-a246-33d9adaa8e77 [Sclerotinia trifoliorum]|uniref:80da0c8a-c322-4e4c-a246-33d9adaa8e77 n=1 Tax=Sclerotinia trifoliorum TaxID=28548 RepID=A0A8H2W210_9HELO|nr:80da0c8a-c322-4e4c-a246-33d9adaa8e77 [Sclerotinia trifoliorum]
MVATATLASCAYYCYVPVMMTGVMFGGTFLQTTAIHIYQISRSKTKFFIPIIVGGLLEAIGYGCRTISHYEAPNFSVIPFAIQYTCILVAPTIMAAAVYMYYEHIVKAVSGESLSPIRLSRFQKIFLFFDCFSALILVVGSILRLMTNIPVSWIRLGNRLVLMGLGEQLVFLVIFVFTVGKFQYNMSRNPFQRLSTSTIPKSSRGDVPYKKHLIALYVASALIAIRSVVRLMENLTGTTGFIRSHEMILTIFDGMFMLNMMFLFQSIHPSEIVVWEEFYASNGANTPRPYFAGAKFWQGKRLTRVDTIEL